MTGNRKFLMILLTVLTAALVIVSPAAAQDRTDPTAFLVYYDDDFELEVFDSSGEYVGSVFTGMELFPGSTIKTYNTTAEIQLDPNGSIIKISENSIFQIEAYQTAADESNDFTLFSGKLRVIAARAGLGYENYSILTESAVCGVRGTDFVIDSIGVLAVLDGAVEFSNLLSGETINVATGQLADIFADTFAATVATAQSLASVFSGMEFVGTDPGQVPGHTVSEPPAADTDDTDDAPGDTDEDSGEDTDNGDETKSLDSNDDPDMESGTDADSGTTTDDAAETAEAPEPPRAAGQGSAAANITGRTTLPTTDSDSDDSEETAETSQPGPFDDFFDSVGDLLSFEIGSITIDGETYAKAVLQPEFEIGILSMGLYLPIIYQDNLFDPGSWYKPAGNNEWSFGTDQTEIGDILYDIMSDLFLKIEYMQIGDNGDDFYFKFGNLDNMTIGHGILMYNFANNTEFPAVRKVGINTGLNFEHFGAEAVLDDASDISIFGGRIVYTPFGSGFPLGFGLSAVTDVNPDSELETSTILFNTMILNGAFDIGLPVKPLGLTFFADLGTITLYDENGWHLETMYDSTQTDFLTAINNYGITAGVYGSIFDIIDYRLDYRLSKGLFRNAFYDSTYLLYKTEYFNQLTTYTADPSLDAYQEITMGVYGELSASLFDAVVLSGGYLWPWTFDGTAVDFSADDYLNISLSLMPDVIPFVGIYGSVSYTRAGLNQSISDAIDGATFQPFDANTVFAGELVYPFDDTVDVSLEFATVLSRDTNGNIIYDDDGLAETYYAFTIDVGLSF